MTANLTYQKFTDEQIEAIALTPPPQDMMQRIEYEQGMKFGKKRVEDHDIDRWLHFDLALSMGSVYFELGFYAYIGLNRRMQQLAR